MKIETVTLQSVSNFSCEIGFFLASLEKIRKEWRESLQDLTEAEFGAKILPDVQPIGALIVHLAEAEYFWIQQIVSGKEMTEEIKNLLHHDLWFKDFTAEDLSVENCLEVVDKIHRMTRETLAQFTDDDLEKMFVRKRKDRETSYNLRWIFVHLLDHEGVHKGQILMIKRLLRGG